MDWILLFLAGTIGGALNAFGGGGSFVTFPLLIHMGIPILNANATSTVALWPGSVASSMNLRCYIDLKEKVTASLVLISSIGSLIGTLLLLRVSNDFLSLVLPYLMLVATLILLFKRHLKSISAHQFSYQGFALQFFVGVYGGFFGGGMGILMMSVFSLIGISSLYKASALKSLLGIIINGVGVLIFAWSGNIVWFHAFFMLIGSFLGGYYGAGFLKRLSPVQINRLVLLVAIGNTLWFFIK